MTDSSGAQRLLLPLVPVYRAALGVKNTAYRRGWLQSRRLPARVISVGNLSVGGAGKTPLVIRLAELLSGRGFAVDVLSRGYGRVGRGVERVQVGAGREPEGPAAARYGDEPLLIARSAGVPVYLGASRYEAGLAAELDEEQGREPRVHLLDDGFQHRQLARSVDIVVLHRSDFTAGLLPAGRLREPLSALRRASVAVLRVEDEGLAPELRRRFPRLPVWTMTREIVLEPTAGTAVAFCGIAHPGEFFASLTRSGVSLAASHAFRDHHAYTNTDVVALVGRVAATGAVRLLTTEKDLVRLNAGQRALLEQAAELAAVPLRARLLDEDASLSWLLSASGLA